MRWDEGDWSNEETAATPAAASPLLPSSVASTAHPLKPTIATRGRFPPVPAPPSDTEILVAAANPLSVPFRIGRGSSSANLGPHAVEQVTSMATVGAAHPRAHAQTAPRHDVDVALAAAASTTGTLERTAQLELQVGQLDDSRAPATQPMMADNPRGEGHRSSGASLIDPQAQGALLLAAATSFAGDTSFEAPRDGTLQDLADNLKDFTDRNWSQLSDNWGDALQEIGELLPTQWDQLTKLGQELAGSVPEHWDSFTRGLAEHVGEPVHEFNQTLARRVSEHVAEPVQEFSQELGKSLQRRSQSFSRGLSEHVGEPVHEHMQEAGRRWDLLRAHVALGMSEHVAEPMRRHSEELGQHLARGVKEKVAEPVQEFSQHLARGMSEHVTEPVQEAGRSFALGVKEKVAEPVQEFSQHFARGVGEHVAEPMRRDVAELVSELSQHFARGVDEHVSGPVKRVVRSLSWDKPNSVRRLPNRGARPGSAASSAFGRAVHQASPSAGPAGSAATVQVATPSDAQGYQQTRAQKDNAAANRRCVPARAFEL